MKSLSKEGLKKLGSIGEEYASQGLNIVKAIKYFIYTLTGLIIFSAIGGIIYATIS